MLKVFAFGGGTGAAEGAELGETPKNTHVHLMG